MHHHVFSNVQTPFITKLKNASHKITLFSLHKNLEVSLLKTQNACFISSDTRQYVGLALLSLRRLWVNILVVVFSKRQIVSINEKMTSTYANAYAYKFG